MDELEMQIIRAEEELMSALRRGDLMQGVSIHLDSPDYRNIWSGEMKTYDELSARITAGMAHGLAAIDYQVSDRQMFAIDEANVMATLTAVETTRMKDGQSNTSGKTIISILWRKIDGRWRLGYLHASEEPRAAESVWQELQ